MYKFVRNFKQKNQTLDDASSSSTPTSSIANTNSNKINNVSNNNEQINQSPTNNTIKNTPKSVINSNDNKILNNTTLTTTTTTTRSRSNNDLTSTLPSTSQDRYSSLVQINKNTQPKKNEIQKKTKSISDLNEEKETTTSIATILNRSANITSLKSKNKKRSSSSSTTTTKTKTTSTNTSLTSSSSSSSSESLSISSDSLSDSNSKQTSTLNIVLKKNNKSVLNEFENYLKEHSKHKSKISTSNNNETVKSCEELSEIKTTKIKRISLIIETPKSDIIMVHSDNNNKKQNKQYKVNDSRYDYLSRTTKDEDLNRKSDVIMHTLTREPLNTKPVVKTVNFRASSYSKNGDVKQKPELIQQQRAYRSLSPNQSSTVAYVIGQQPQKSILVNKLDSSKVYYAEAIGHGKHLSPPRQPLTELRHENTKNQRKRIRSPSGSKQHNEYYTNINKTSCNRIEFKRDYDSLMNLANKASFRIRFARDKTDDSIFNNKKSNKQDNTKVNRSLSVNYLYNKRQSDLRKFQNNNFNEIHLKNHIGFTTEDIEDIYMPQKLDQFESKLKASLDLSESSDQEIKKQKKKILDRQSRQANKRLKSEMNDQGSQRIIINIHNNTKNNNNSTLSSIASLNSQTNKSYLEEAKRKLEQNRANSYFYDNLNNKLKSSVSNVIKATHDLTRHHHLNRNSSLNEVYDLRKNEIRSNLLSNTQSMNDSLTLDDIDNVYMPWMIENYGRKLVIEALKRRSNMIDSLDGQSFPRPRNKSPYVSQYYPQQTHLMPNIKRNDLWLIHKDVNRYVKRSRQSSHDQLTSIETEVSISDSETSSDDTRPIVPEKINKPDISLKNKILKTINKSLLSTELTGIDLKMLKLNDFVRRISRRIEKDALERDLELDLIRSFSCNHLADLRREDIRYNNLQINRQSTNFNSFTTDDIIDLYMPKALEAFKLKSVIQKQRKIKFFSNRQTPKRNRSPIRIGDQHIYKYKLTPHLVTVDEFNDRKVIASSPPVLIKSPSLTHKLPPNSSITIRTAYDPNSLIPEIIQERLNDFDVRMARQINVPKRKQHQNQLRFKQANDSDMDVDDYEEDEEEAVSTDQDQDDSLDHSSTSGSDDLNMNEDDLKNFDYNSNTNTPRSKPNISKSKIESTINRSLTLKNPGELISDFYINNMNYAMRYSVEHVQKFAKDLRRRRERQDSINKVVNEDTDPRLNRSFSVDRLYAVRREHIRYSNGADEDFGTRNISFTTDDIQDIYMPSSIDNYKRKIAVELERRRRFVENDLMQQKRCEQENDLFKKASRVQPPEMFNYEPPVVLDELDLHLIKRAKSSIEKEDVNSHVGLVKAFQPTIQLNQAKKQPPYHKVTTTTHIYRQESPVFLESVDMISREPFRVNVLNRAQVTKPDIKYVPKSSVKPHSPERVKEHERVKLERANVSIANNTSDNYALINKVSTLVDNEIVPSSSSSSVTEDSISPTLDSSAADSLDNIDLDNFETRYPKHKQNIFTRQQSKLTPKDVIEISRLNRKIEDQTAARLEALATFNSSNLNSSRHFENIIDQSPNNKVNISIVKTFSLANQFGKKEAELIEFNTAQYLPREPNYKIEQNELRMVRHESVEDLILNAPKIKEDLIDMQQVKDLPSTPRVPVKDPEYIIEEFAHKSIDSSIVYSYENVDPLKPKQPVTSKLKSSQEIPRAMSFVSINQDEILEDVGYLESSSDRTQSASSSINKPILSKLDAKNEPIKLHAPISREETLSFQSVADSIHLPRQDHQKASLVQQEIISLEQPAHILEPVNLKTANLNECEPVESMEIDSHLTSNELALQTKVKETKQANETINSIDWIKRNVFNLAEIKLDSTELNFAHPFDTEPFDTKQQLSQRENVQILKSSAKTIVASVLNSARQITEQDGSNECVEIDHSKLVSNPCVATQKSEEFYLNLKPSTFKIATLNAPIKNQTSFTEDEDACVDLEQKEDQLPVKSAEPKPHVDELIKPPIAKKPVIINHAKQFTDKQETTINISRIDKEDNLIKQNIKLQRHSSDLTTIDQVKITGSIVPLGLAETNKEKLQLERLTEYRSQTQEPIKVNVTKEKMASLRATQSSPIELICDGVVNKSDEFLESVKPMDTIEIDFNESINLKTTQALFSPGQNENKVNIKITQSFNRPETRDEQLPHENCDEFISKQEIETIKTFSTTKSENFESVQVKPKPTQLILPQEEIEEFKEENSLPILVESDYYENEVVFKEETSVLKTSESLVSKKINKMAVGEIRTETQMEEESKELESIHLSLIEPSSPNKIVETKIDIVRIEKPAVQQQILNNPVSSIIQTETVNRFQPEQLDYERPKFGIEITEVNDDKQVIRVKMLNLPQHSTEKFDEQNLERIIPVSTSIEKAQTTYLKNDCTLKADVEKVKNFSMATILNQDDENDELKETQTNQKSLYEQANENLTTSLNEISNNDSQIKKVKLDHYGRGQEVIEIINNTFTCDPMETSTSKMVLTLTTVPVDSEEEANENIHIKSNLIRNLANENNLPDEECQNLNKLDVIQPNEIIQQNTFEESTYTLRQTSVLVHDKVEDKIDADKQMLRWLNYPQGVQNEEEPESNIDEKLDYLYEKIKTEKTVETETPEMDLNIVKVEKVLNRIISNEEKIENEYELVQYVSQCRPELQQLLISNQSDFQNAQNSLNQQIPVRLNRAQSVEHIIEEAMSTQISESYYNLNTTETLELKELTKVSQTSIKKPIVLSSAIEIKQDEIDEDKVNNLIKQSVNKLDAVESFTTTLNEPASNKHTTESTVIFNLPTMGRLARLDETSTEFYDASLKEKVSQETVELICFQTLNNIVQQTLVSAPLTVEAREEKVDNEIKSINELSCQLDIVREERVELDKVNRQTPFQELIAPYMNSFKYVEEKCSQFETSMEEHCVEINTAPNEVKQLCSLDQPVEWEVLNNQEVKNEARIQKTSQEIVKKVLMKSIIQSELQPAESSQQINLDWINNVKNIEPVSTSVNSIINNVVEKYQPVIENKEMIVNLNNTDDDIGSFIEQIEKIELISSDNLTKYENGTNLLQHTIEHQHVIHHSSKSLPLFTIEKEKLNRIVEQIEVPKWEECKSELKQLNETINDEDVSLSETSSSESSKIHLIESVEVVTHHNKQDQEESKLNETIKEDDDEKLHIHKVDINRLQIREKSPRKYKDLDESLRFKVDFKQEEVVDLRDLAKDENQNETDGQIDLASDKVFAKKFVDQIVQLSTSKLADYEAQNANNNLEYDESILKYDNLNFNKISNKSSSEILESLSHLKFNIGKHLTESVVGNKETTLPSKVDNPSNKTNNLKTSFYDEDDNDSLKEARDEFFENFDNRLHSTYNHGNNSTIVNSSIDTEDYFSEKFEEEIEIIKQSTTTNVNNFQIPIHIEYEFNDQSFANNNKKDKETIEILTEVTRRRNDATCDSVNNSVPSSTLVKETMTNYLSNLSNLVIDSVNSNKQNLSEDETETSIRETVTVEIKNKENSNLNNQKMTSQQQSNESKIYSNYEMHQIVMNEKVDELDDFEPKSTAAKYSNRFNLERLTRPIDGSTIQKIVEKLPDIQDFDETVEIVDSVVIDHVSEDDKSISSEEVTYERWTEETKLFKTKVFKDGELINEIVEESHPELVGDILREKLIERHEHITHISQDVKKRVKTKSPGQSRRQSLDIAEILNNDLNGSNVIIVEPTIPSTTRRNSSSDNTYYIQHQQVITPSKQQIGSSSLKSGTKHKKISCSHSKSSILSAYFKNHMLDSANISPNSSSSSLSASSFLLNNTDTPLSKLITNHNHKKHSSNSNFRKRFSKYSLKRNDENSNHNHVNVIKHNNNLVNALNYDSFCLSSSSSSSTSSFANLKAFSLLTKSNNYSTANDFLLKSKLENHCTINTKLNSHQSLNIEKSLLSSSSSSDSSFLLNNTLLKDDNAPIIQLVEDTLPQIKTTTTNQQQISNISTFYGGLEAHNLITDNSDDVLIVKTDYKEANKPVIAPSQIDIRSLSPPFNGRNEVVKRTDLVKSQFEKITSADLLSSSSSSSSSHSSSFDKVSVNYIITSLDGVNLSRNEDDDNDSDSLNSIKSNKPDSNNEDDNNMFNKSSSNDNLDDALNQQEQRERKDQLADDFVLIDKIDELTASYCDVNYELNEDTYQNKANKLISKTKLENDDNTTTSDSLESMERFKRPTKLEMIKNQQQKIDLTKTGLLVHDDDNSSHIDTSNSLDTNQFISKGKVKNYALMFQQKDMLKPDASSSSSSSSSSASTSKKFNEYLSKFETPKTEDTTNKFKRLLDQFSKLNDYMNLVITNQSDVDTLTDCANKTRDSFNAFDSNESNNIKSAILIKRFAAEYEKYSNLFIELKASNLNHNQIIFNLDALKELIESKFAILLVKQASSGSSSNQSILDIIKPTFGGSSSIQSSNQFSEKLGTVLVNPIIPEESTKQSEPLKQEDMTDISDEDEPNIFESSNLVISNSPQSLSVLDKVKVFDTNEKPRALPLRRESFEMAQKDAASKRLSLSNSINNNGSSTNDSTSTSSDTTSLSNQINQLKQMQQQQQQPISTTPTTNKRMLTEIKPTEVIDRTSDEYQLIDDEFDSYFDSKKMNELIENESSNILLNEKSIESDSSDSSRHILQRNYDILRKKSSSTTKKSRASYTEEQRVIDSFEDEESTKLNSIGSQQFKVEEPSPPPLRSYVSSSNLTPKPVDSETTAQKLGPKIKYVQKSTQADAKNRSVSPGMLRRGPDIIETIETTTSMSFIMNKRINLVVEEKRLEPPFSKVDAKPKLTNAISQPQLYQSEIDDLLNSTGNLIMNNANMRQKQSSPIDQSNSIPIPITVQSRSKSEPRLDMDEQTKAQKNNLILSHDFNNINHNNIKRRPLISNGKYYEIPTAENNNITFHKYDSNEIIALVNMPNSYEQTTTTTVTTNESKSHSHYNTTSPIKNFSRSEPNLNKRIDSWSAWPEYTVDQETDSSSVGSNDRLNKINNSNSAWVNKSEIKPTRITYPNNCYEFEIEVEKRHISGKPKGTSISIDGRPANAKITNKEGRILIENVSLSPGNEIVIQSDFTNDSNTFNKRRHLNRLNSHSAVNTSNGMSNTSVEQEVAAATRISSGYFSGDEFRSYYNNTLSNPTNINNIINAPLHQQANISTYDQNSSNSNFYASNNNSCSSPNSTSNEPNTTTASSNNHFNIGKFLNRNKNKSKKDALDEFNSMYKSLGLEEDELVYERTNVNDHPLYGKIDIDIHHNDKPDSTRVNFNFCHQSSPRNGARNHQRSRSTNYDKLDHERFAYSSINLNDAYTGLDNSETFSNFSIYNESANNNRSNYTTSKRPDTLKDDMAHRRCKTMTPSQLEREIYINNSYLNKSPANFEQSFTSSNYNTSFNNNMRQVNEPDIARDDASILNMRKRSNSLSSLSNVNSQLETPVNPLILPSPTCADYLRNRIRETTLYNVVMKPTKNTTDVELSQILYDDMAYRQLRKDSDAYKIAQIKSAANNMATPMPSTPVLNIATLPINYSNKTTQQTDAYYQQFFSSSTTNNTNTQFANDDYETLYGTQAYSTSKRNSQLNNSNIMNESNVKTVKMIKQKDASNKNLKQYSSSSNPNKLLNPQYDANRYFINATNKEINEYYDTFNQMQNQSNLESLL